jgi:TonB family protein
MGSLRSLLRFDEKVAAEGRRIQNLGGPPLRWVAPVVLFAALSLHAAILLLPAVHSQVPNAVASPVPDFPRVWRAASPAPAPAPQPTVRRRPAAPEPPPAPASSVRVGRLVRPFPTEPVPEPAPDLVLNAVPADVEAIIPNPDRPPPAPELGPPSRVPPVTTVEIPPALLERVPPVYPVVARSLRAEARVMLRLIVLPDGRVSGATVVDCTRKGLGFEASALDAVKRWRYEPAPPGSGARRVPVTIHFRQADERP